jgi:hypothetical protein
MRDLDYTFLIESLSELSQVTTFATTIDTDETNGKQQRIHQMEKEDQILEADSEYLNL